MRQFERLLEEADNGGQAGGGSALSAPPKEIPDWKSELPEDMRAHNSIQQYKDIPSLVKSYISQQPLIGSDKIPAPKDTWTDEDWSAHYNRLGRPETPDKYTVPEGAESLVESLRDELHTAGLTDLQAQKIIKSRMEAFDRESSDLQAKLTDFKNTLGDKFDETLDLARNVVRKFGDESMMKYLDESGLGNSPELITFLAKAGRGLLEDGGRGSNSGNVSHFGTDARVELTSRMQDSKWTEALYNSGHPDHERVVEENIQLQRRINPEKVAFF